MASKTLFKSILGKLIPRALVRNEAGGPAYAFEPRHALAQYVATGCLNGTYYATDEQQLQNVLTLCETVKPSFIAKTALYGRSKGFMKDLPALLCAVLSVKAPDLMAKIFDRVIDDGRMLRNFVQMIRSGQVGRKSLGSRPKRLVQHWFETRDDAAVFRASVGNDPSLADIVKMVHPRPASPSRQALYGYLIGREVVQEDLPEVVRQFEAFKADASAQMPDVPFQMLTSLELTREHWVDIARRAPWQMTRMNLNTFARHGVFDVAGLAELIAKRLADPALIAKARVFPYQLMVAYTQADATVPHAVREALQDAMEVAIRNVPEIPGKVYVFPDVSGSMSSPVTGVRRGATTAVRCIDVAALVAAAVLRRNSGAGVIPFEQAIVSLALNPRDSVMTNAAKLAGVGGGGTNCSAPLAELNRTNAQADLVLYVSDNESWVDAKAGRGTETMRQWNILKQRCPKAKMVCIDIQPYGTTQAHEREDILNIGGFSDHVFETVALFAADKLGAGHWVEVIESEVI